MNFKHIHIGKIILQAVSEKKLTVARICNFIKCKEEEVEKMYQSESLDSETLLRWSKLLEYDFFRIYSQHLIFYAPASSGKKEENAASNLPQFRKNMYTKEVINFITEQIKSGEMTKAEVIEKYKIPGTTLSRWIKKYEK